MLGAILVANLVGVGVPVRVGRLCAVARENIVGRVRLSCVVRLLNSVRGIEVGVLSVIVVLASAMDLVGRWVSVLTVVMVVPF